MIYDYYKERSKKNLGGKVIAGILAVILALAVIFAKSIYMNIIELDEIGNFSSVYTTNLIYKTVFAVIGFLIIFLSISITNIFIRKNMKHYLQENSMQEVKLPNYLIASVLAFFGALMTKEYFFQKAINFLNSTPFGQKESIFSNDIGYYVFQRPFFMAIYEFISVLWLFVIIYTVVNYSLVLFSVFQTFSIQDLKIKTILRHNLINIAIFFIIKVVSYKFQKEGLLYSRFINVNGAGYVDINLWLNYYNVAPILLILIVIVSLFFITKSQFRKAAYTIAIFPAFWFIAVVLSIFLQSVIVKPNEINLESQYLKINMEKTREAYNINKIRNFEFPKMQDLNPDIINRNIDTKNNIRIVDYNATLQSDTQLQSNTNFYSFQDGDIINYNINGKEIPIFITAREIDKNKLPAKSYINTTFKYTHGYGIVINPINNLTSEGQVDFILSGLRMDSDDKNLKVAEPRIYYGEMTNDHIVTNAGNNLKEIDYDGNSETSYTGKGGIKFNLLNRLLYAAKYKDINFIISGYISPESKLLLNRNVIQRAQKAVPFLTVDTDPYVLLTKEGKLTWVLDAYTTTSYYPYSNYYPAPIGDKNFNYIRNSVKIVIDAYDGTVKYYIVDKTDPIINTYKKAYPGVFSEEPLPQDIAQHTRYPEYLFSVQTNMLKRYHLDPNTNPNNVSMFYSNQDLWDVAKFPGNNAQDNNTSEVRDIDPYYNMIKLPGDLGQKEELILMRPFTPSKKHNMVSWLSVRNSFDNYGEMILFTFPKNTNILGPYQVETNINSIDKVSKDMTLWGQSGSRVFKGSLLVIPIEDSVLYVEPIYIQASGPSSIPQVREIVVGYQKGEEFKYGIGTNLDDALNQLFAGAIKTPAQQPEPSGNNEVPTDEKLVNDIIKNYDTLKQQLDELGKLIDELSK